MKQAELQPRPEAWAKLEQRMSEKKKPVWWLQYSNWMVAASVALVMIGVAFWLTQNNELDQQSIASVVKTDKAKPSTSPSPSSLSSQTEITSPLPVSAQASPSTVSAQTTIAKAQKEAIASNSAPLPVSSQASPSSVSVTPTSVSPQTTIAKAIASNSAPLPVSAQAIQNIQKPEIAQVENINKTLPVATPNIQNESSKNLEKVVVMKLPEIVSENYNSEIATTLVSAENSQKKSRFIKIFKQIKNFKTGERIEWDEVGVNPNKLIAKANKTIEKEDN